MTFRRSAALARIVIGLLLLSSAIVGQAPGQSGTIAVLSREGRRTLAVSDVQGHAMVALGDLATLFQLTVREDSAARAVTVSYKNQTIVLTPDQSLASLAGRLVSLPAPLTRQGQRWLVPVEFISRGLTLIYDTRLDLRPASRLLIVGDIRVPRVTAQYEDTAGLMRVTLAITPKANAVVTQDQNRLLVRIDADALDAALAAPPQNGLVTSVHAVEPNTIQLDLGPRFSSFRSTTPTSAGAGAQVTIELLPTAPDSSSAAPTPAPPPSVAASDLPVFGATARRSIRTIVIDAGHGGDDSGVKGAGGNVEKDLTLSVAKRVKVSIEGRLGIRVLLTREGDARMDADSRASIANNNKADLFISLHANGSPRPTTRGAIIYSLNLDRFGEETRRQSEGTGGDALPVYGGGTRDLSIVDWEMAQAPHVQDSVMFAGLVEQKLRTSANMKTTSVQKAILRALAGANMPAVLIEMGYLSNPDEEKVLAAADFQTGVAQALTEAVIAFRDQLGAQ